MSKAALVVRLRHTWYLTKDCISISIFNIEVEVCNKFAKKIGRLPSSHLYIEKPFLPSITPTFKISEFVGPRSIFNFYHSFLLAEHKWAEDKWAEDKWAVVDDWSERALNMATSYNGRIIKDETSFQNLMLVVEAHRKKYGFPSKTHLKNFYDCFVWYYHIIYFPLKLLVWHLINSLTFIMNDFSIILQLH